MSVQGPAFCAKVLLRLLVPKERLLAFDVSADLVVMCERRNPPKCLSFAVGDAPK